MLYRVVLALIFIVSAADAALAEQRMGLVTGSSVRLGPNSTGTLASRCMDEHAPPPSTSSNYSNVLSENSDAAVVVKYDGKKLSLQKAINDKIIAITGVSPPIPGTRATITQLRVVNLTDKPVEVRVEQGVLLGTSRHTIEGLDGAEGLLESGLGQRDVWQRLATEQKLAILSENEKAEVKTRSTAAMRLFTAVTSGEGLDVIFPDGVVRIEAKDWETLKAGKPLADDHELSGLLKRRERTGYFVMYTNHVKERTELLKSKDSQEAGEQLVLALQRAYPKSRVFRDPYSPETDKAAKKLAEAGLVSLDELLIVVAADSFSVDDKRIINNIKPALIEIGMTEGNAGNIAIVDQATIKDKAGMATGKKAVVVITGHIDEKLRQFVEELGKAGYFNDKLVILNSCNEGSTVEIASRICHDFGAIGTFYYDGKIPASSIEDLVVSLVKDIKSGSAGRLIEHMRKLLDKVNLNGAWTISLLQCVPCLSIAA
jgi:hypothetical protein